MKPFADDAQSTSIGGLTVENGAHRIAIYGTLDLTRDKAGLAAARQLAQLAAAAVAALEADAALPDHVAAPTPPRTVANPFA